MEGFPDYETVEYHVIYGALIDAARYQGTVTYQNLATLVGLPTVGSHMANRLGYLLGAISANEINQGRPMLSAVAVNAQGRVSDGFFVLARQLGLLSDSATRDEELKFLSEHRNVSYDIWKQTYFQPKKSK